MKTTAFPNPDILPAVSEEYFECLCDKYINSLYGVVFRAVNTIRIWPKSSLVLYPDRVVDNSSNSHQQIIPSFSRILKITVCILKEIGYVLTLSTFTPVNVVPIQPGRNVDPRWVYLSGIFIYE